MSTPTQFWNGSNGYAYPVLEWIRWEEEEAPKKGPNYELLSYAVSDSNSDIESTARSGPKCNELEDTCEKMAPNMRSGPNNNENPDIAAIIAQQLQNILPQIVTQVINNVNNVNANGGGGNGRNDGNNERSYKRFMTCNPKKYDEKGDVIALTRWIEKMENVIDNSGCYENQKTDFKALLVDEFYPSNEMEKLEIEFWNHKMVGVDHSDDQSLYDEDVIEKIFPIPLFEEEIIPMKIDQHHDNAESDLVENLCTHDSSLIISSKTDSLLDEFASELTLLKSIPPRIDETDCDHEEDIRLIERLLYNNSSPRPPEEFVYENSNAEIESFSPSPIPVEDSDSFMKEIDLSFTPDGPMPPGIEEDDYDSERDILTLEELLENYSFSLPVKESFHFDIPSFSRPLAKPPDGNTGILNVKMMGDISEQKVPMVRLMITLVPNQEKSPDLLSHQGLETFQPFAECPMMIHKKNTPILDVLLFHFYPP
nr:hypothetical protein [Tanacetum cinerariifolium]